MGITGKWCGRAEQDLGEYPSGMGRWSYDFKRQKISCNHNHHSIQSVSSINTSTWGLNNISPTTYVNVKTRDKKSKPKGTICSRHNYFHQETAEERQGKNFDD